MPSQSNAQSSGPATQSAAGQPANMESAISAIQSGDLAALRQLIAEDPELISRRADDETKFPPGYFHKPKLLWFVAFNPIFSETMPANMVSIAETIIDAGAEPQDVTYTLELVMTGRVARENQLQRPLMKLLLERGAKVTPLAIYMTLGHRERDAVRYLLDCGEPMTTEIAAGMGMTDELKRLFDSANPDQRHAAFSLAVINDETEAAKYCLEKRVDPNKFLVVHRHSTPAHQAAYNGNVPMLKLLHQHGAKFDVRDTGFDSTPLGWAIHAKKPEAEAYLRSIAREEK